MKDKINYEDKSKYTKITAPGGKVAYLRNDLYKEMMYKIKESRDGTDKD